MIPDPLLIITDPDPAIYAIVRAVAGRLHMSTQRNTAAEALRMLQAESAALVVVPSELPGSGTADLIAHVRFWCPETVILMTSNSPSFSEAVAATRSGVFDYLPKPLDPSVLELTIERALEEHRLRNLQLALRHPQMGDPGPYFGIVGQSPAMLKLYRLIGKVSRSTSPVLLWGETGTGKELVARAIHFTSNRRDKPFVPIDCGALVPTLMETELFGHERGAFTGADRAREGLLRMAQGGTAFLDEVGELPPEMQAKLLRTLQQKEVRPVGGARPVRIDVRIIAATNRDLGRAVQEGSFRKDLFFRLNVVTLQIPPLRDRLEDLELLVEEFLDRYARANNESRRRISKEAMRMLKTHSWPGNVRELENYIERALSLTTQTVIEPIDFPTALHQTLPPSKRSTEPNPVERAKHVVPMAELEKHAILHAMAVADGDRMLAARMLGISKTTLYRRVKEYEAEARNNQDPSGEGVLSKRRS